MGCRSGTDGETWSAWKTGAALLNWVRIQPLFSYRAGPWHHRGSLSKAP